MATRNLESAPVTPRAGVPVVALVGRPNVGKSTLFSRLVKKKSAIVHEEPGVTRDRHYADAFARGRRFTLIDTGGLDPGAADPMRVGIRRQIGVAIEEADVIVCVLDATANVTAEDHAEMDVLRRAQKRVIYAANKVDSSRAEADMSELYRLGMDELVAISALHGRGTADLEKAIAAALPADLIVAESSSEIEDAARPIRVAIVGRPNAGKSSLVNQIVGSDRVLVDARAGTTRDAVDTLVERGGHRLVLIDTAGIRRKAKVAKEHDFVEAASVTQAIVAMERAEVVVLLVDAADCVSEQDAKVLGLAVDRGCAVVIALNKIDLLKPGQLAKAHDDTRDKLSFAPWAPIVHVSAETGRGASTLLRTVANVASAFRKRVSTGELNRFFAQTLDNSPPPTQKGRAPRLFFITQVEASPPLFVIVANSPNAIHFSYQRYVTNQIRESFGFEGVPIRLKFKEKRKRSPKSS